MTDANDTKQHTIRVVLAKLGLDGHDRGLKVVAHILRDAGMEVIYLGLRQTTDSIVAAAEEEDADAVGLSMHNASHMTLAPKMVEALAEAELDVPVIVGGIIPEEDAVRLEEAGVKRVYTPKDFDLTRIMDELVDVVSEALRTHRSTASEPRCTLHRRRGLGCTPSRCRRRTTQGDRSPLPAGRCRETGRPDASTCIRS